MRFYPSSAPRAMPAKQQQQGSGAESADDKSVSGSLSFSSLAKPGGGSEASGEPSADDGCGCHSPLRHRLDSGDDAPVGGGSRNGIAAASTPTAAGAGAAAAAAPDINSSLAPPLPLPPPRRRPPQRPSSAPCPLPASALSHPSAALLRNSGFKQIAYEAWRARALAERAARGPGRCDEANSWYRFLSYFLRIASTRPCTPTSSAAATADAAAGARYGLECLFRFWSYGLEKRFDAALYRDFESAVLADFESGVSTSLYGVEKFWAFHHYAGPARRVRPDDGRQGTKMESEGSVRGFDRRELRGESWRARRKKADEKKTRGKKNEKEKWKAFDEPKKIFYANTEPVGLSSFPAMRMHFYLPRSVLRLFLIF